MTEIYRLHRLSLTAPGEFLFAALAAAVPGMSRGVARDAVMAGLVKVDDVVVTLPKHLLDERPHAVEADLRHGTKRALEERVHGREPVAERPFTVLYEDDHVVVVDKAAGVLSAPMGQTDGDAPERGHVPELLRRMWRKRGRAVSFVGVVHRLDKETSGCLCFALTRTAQTSLAAQFSRHSAGRTYRCLTDGAPSRDEFTLAGVIAFGPDGRRCFRFDEAAADRIAARARGRAQDDDGDVGDDGSGDDGGGDEESGPRAERRSGPGRDAVTHVRVVRRLRRGADLEVTLETGRTHQIRVSLLAIGCPVAGDHVYFRRDGGAARGAPPRPPRAPRMMLHAEKLAFDHPVTGRRIEVTAPLPDAFAAHARLLDR
jgi:23S rRNA-/tRNA-specific pseudouridylate synthase